MLIDFSGVDGLTVEALIGDKEVDGSDDCKQCVVSRL